MTEPDADAARSVLMSIVTAAHNQDFETAQRITYEFSIVNNGIMPLLVSSISLIETILLSISEEIGMPADKLLQGIALGLSIKQMEQNNQQGENNDT